MRQSNGIGAVNDGASELEDLLHHLTELINGRADIESLRKIAKICHNNPVGDAQDNSDPFPLTPSPKFEKPIPMKSTIWMKDTKLFNRLFDALIQFLDHEKVCALSYAEITRD